MMNAGQICIRGVCTVAKDESIYVVARKMKDCDLGILVIVDEMDTPIGVITDRDLAMRVVAENRDPDLTTAGEVMSEESIVVDAKMSLECALQVMRSGQYRRLPVIDGTGKLVGLLSVENILEELAAEFHLVGSV
jgi:CBS domain-containing protein